ncbi:MAG: bifunctional hydroxymethylpyrimidine kinase/phosphomethylpyrimidine kinase [Synergistaceae bacterium]
MRKVLTIAGSDCSGGAGIQADLKTMSAYNVYGMSVITALTAQNTTGVYGINEIKPEFVAQQIDVIFSDITPDAVKIGMVSNIEIIKKISEKLKQYNAKNIVVDPVMVATSGGKLLNPDSIEVLKKQLISIADLITPNIPEAEVLSEMKIETKETFIEAGEKISQSLNCNVLIKGGHLEESADDLLIYKNGEILWFKGEKINTQNTHGTGCTLSSAIASGMALGMGLAQSIEEAKKYVTGALSEGLDLGRGNGPLNHCYRNMKK